MTHQVHHRYVTVQGHQIFYREAGPRDAPTIVLLHGFPSSSFMYRNLIPQLADRYHVVAPDYPGYGWSDAPKPSEFTYDFESVTAVMVDFLAALKLESFALYIQDFGAPVGLRIASRQPARVTAIITQNGNAYVDGLAPEFLAFLQSDDRDSQEVFARSQLTLDATKWQYLTGVPDPTLVDPDAFLHDQTLLDRPGNDAIQVAMLTDYPHNLPIYPEIHRYFRESQVPLLAVWGANDPIFIAAGATAYQKDLPNAEIHLLDSGHFALETHADTIAAYALDFLDRALKG
ncbi:alpha/beta fold hydrolase [Fodinicola feengrottensis]|uniref:Alpha/beta hydrolase n=1 Tax=Fodinicola feengrottensis TaxID=435914 RepID=A0ABN2IR45_9ACTN|nr:alpha/beta hydrolase [Fodinicola feengrottensis]